VFTARNRQNPFAARKRRAAEAEAAAQAEPIAAPFDRNPESEEYVQAPDIATYATGGVVEQPKPVLVEPSADEEHEAADELNQLDQTIEAEMQTDHYAAIPVLSPETQAKIDAVMSHAIPPVAEPLTLDELIETAEPGPAPIAEPETPPESEPKRGRGRPRPQETIDRDNAVHDLLKAADADEGVSKEALAISLDEKEQQVYSSLRQLSKEGRAETRYVKGHGYRWFAV